MKILVEDESSNGLSLSDPLTPLEHDARPSLTEFGHPGRTVFGTVSAGSHIE